MWHEINILGRHTSRYKNNIVHPIHKKYAEASRIFHCTLDCTKRQHWRDWLECASDPDIWIVHKVISAATTNGAKAWILALKYRNNGEEEVTANTNSKKL